MEVLSPAGSLEKIKYAVEYGADAVYAAGKNYGLRAKAGNLDELQLHEAVDYCHKRGKKLYITLNIYAHNRHYDHLAEYVNQLYETGVDAVIVSDAGVLSLVKETAPKLDIHLSTQANTTSWKAAEFWHKQGVKRIILARELTAPEIKQIIQAVPDMEFEIFAHGAMCIAYSGRCLLSAFLNNRSANQGLCTHPCRWKYHLYEESRPNQYFPIEEDENGTYILNSKDISLFEQLPELIDLGLSSIKIEGRMKSIYYTANTTRIYKTAINDLLAQRVFPSELKEELDKVSHRQYGTGFFVTEDNTAAVPTYESSNYIRDYQFLGQIISSEMDGTGYYLYSVNIKSKFSVGEVIDIIFPDPKRDVSLTVKEIMSADGDYISETKPNTIVKIRNSELFPEFGLLRKRI